MFDELVGTPFVDGGKDRTGFDCWGLVCYIYLLRGIELPHYAISAYDSARVDEQIGKARASWQQVDLCMARTPDALLFRLDPAHRALTTHVGVLLNNGRFIHCLAKTGVIISRLAEPFYTQSLVGAYRWSP
jgi:cell wall-associated NlpC family hydrolase